MIPRHHNFSPVASATAAAFGATDAVAFYSELRRGGLTPQVLHAPRRTAPAGTPSTMASGCGPLREAAA